MFSRPDIEDLPHHRVSTKASSPSHQTRISTLKSPETIMEPRIVQTSAVYLLGCPNRPSLPPPSPPSPLSPRSTAESDCGPVEDLSLDSPASSRDLQDGTDTLADSRVRGATHVLKTEATALESLSQLYEADDVARDGFNRAVAAITRHGGERGKLVVIGVGKSGHIGRKLVATFNSLAVQSTFLHPTEALHGDLGTIGKHDTILFITFSGKTQELLSLLPHIEPSLPQIILTSHIQPETCEMIKHRKEIILLPAPIHEPEALSFGVCAPTTSTTMALAVGDALAVVASRELHSCVATVFSQNHPGGAIGAAAIRSPGSPPGNSRTIRDVAVPMPEIPVLDDNPGVEHSGAEVLRMGYGSKNGWVRAGDGVAPPSRIRALGSVDLTRRVEEIEGLVVERRDMVAVSSRTDVRRAGDMIRGLIGGDEEGELDGEGGERCRGDGVVAVVEEGEIVGVLEVGVLLDLA